MNRHVFFTAATLAALSMGCGEEMTETDAGNGGEDAGTPTDAGPGDAGTDAGARDAGPPAGCMGAGCEFVELDLGILHSCGRRENGEVMCWGYNQDLQLGDNRGRHEECNEPGREPADCSGTPVNVRYDTGGTFPIIDDATALAVDGFSASCALRGGQMWCWSNETVPDVAGGTPRTRPVAVLDNDLTDVQQASVTGGHACAIVGTAGDLRCVGSNGVGQLGNGEISTEVVDFAPVLLDPTATPPTELTGVLEVEVSTNQFTCARTADAVYCWGLDTSDQLGDANEMTQTCMLSATEMPDCASTPRLVGGSTTPLGEVADIAVGSRHVCAIQAAPGSAGPVVCWGDNRLGQSGQADPATNQSLDVPTEVTGVADVIQLAASGGTTYALHSDGTISAWGFNDRGQLGDGSTDHSTNCTSGDTSGDCSITPVTVATIDDATYIAANASHACAIRGDGSVWCWGINTNRQLGDGTRETRFEPVMVMDTAP